MNIKSLLRIGFICGLLHPLYSGEVAVEKKIKIGVLSSLPMGSFRDNTTQNGLGLDLGIHLTSISPSTDFGIFAEYKKFTTNPRETNLAQFGFDFRTRINSHFYARYGLSAVNLKINNADRTTKLGGIFGFGYNLSKQYEIEIYESKLASSTIKVTSINLAFRIKF